MLNRSSPVRASQPVTTTPVPARSRWQGLGAMPSLARMICEMAVLFGILFAIDHFLLSGHAFAEVDPNPYWLPVLIIALGYGSGMGLAAAVIATLIWVAAPHHSASGDHLQMMLSVSILPMLWVIAALVAGELTTSRLDRIDGLQRSEARLAEELGQLADTVERLAQTNRAFQVRIATEEHTVGKAIAAAVDLIDSDPARLLHGVERLVALAVQSEDFICYTGTGNRLVARFRGHAAESRPDELSREQLKEALLASLNRQGAASGRVVPTHPGTLALPIVGQADNAAIGVLVINSITPAHLTASKLAEFNHVAQSLGKLAHLLSLGTRPIAHPATLQVQEGVA